jgi:ferredoxin-thioredoxin reductase catalytic chain
LVQINIPPGEIDARYRTLKGEAEKSGYHLNPDVEFTRSLVEGLMINERRYGYASCPCRLTFGTKEENLDIICPCDYRDPDLADYGACYCALYVSAAVAEGKKEADPVPERRLPPDARVKPGTTTGTEGSLPYPILRCPVCGYLCARQHPPEVCPICRAGGERFSRYIE